MKKFVHFSIVLCFLAFVMSMPIMYVPPIELRAAAEDTYDGKPTETIYWYIKASKDAEGNEIVNDNNFKICTLIIS